MKLTPLLQGVDIEEDLGIPLSYDAAWKIFNRWPQEVRVKHKPLGQKKPPSKQAFCFCAQKNCNTRCPFFGLCKKSESNTEDKLHGIMSHREGERDESAYKGLLHSLNKWYNRRCAAGSSQVLDLSKLEQLKIKYKVPAYSVCRTNCSGRRRRECKPTFHYNSKHAAQSHPVSDASSSGKRKKRSKTSDLMDTSELYYTIEKQLRNLSVSQSRLKQMSVSLCRLAYAKKRGSARKLKPKVYKRRESRNRYRYDIPIACNSTSDSCGYTDTGKVTVNERKKCSKLIKKSKFVKSSDTSKSGKMSDSSKSSKSTSQTDKSDSSKRSKASKTSKTTDSSKDTNSSRTTESSRATKSSRTTESSRATKSSRTAESSRATKSSNVTESSRSAESSKSSGSNKTSESDKTGSSSKRSRAGKTSGTSKTSGSYKSVRSTKNAHLSRDSETSKTSGSGGISKTGRKSGGSSEINKTGASSKTADNSKTSGNRKRIETSESIETHTSLETGRTSNSNQCIVTSRNSPQIDSTGVTSTNADDISVHSRIKRTKNSNKPSKTLETHSIIKGLRLEIEKRNKRRSAHIVDVEGAHSPKMEKQCPKLAKPPTQRLGGDICAYGRRGSGSGDTSHRYGANINRTRPAKPPTKYTPTEKITPLMRLAKSSLKPATVCGASSVSDDLHFRHRRKIVKKPAVRISKPILALFGKKRTPSNHMMALCSSRSRCFLIKGN
ncbi:dentin sialophosphoprotein-like [Ceratitis capitata]|uniref:dentin sialophosphoprotein-like n=1 Tax=Ceratitis capitata TaxID=7213 RepID=UPI00061884E7|nr:dentin sialophosphoprotein-like [Ceratitis capitata]